LNQGTRIMLKLASGNILLETAHHACFALQGLIVRPAGLDRPGS
jgi:hypothetical protein